jgi:hypothetical protein
MSLVSEEMTLEMLAQGIQRLPPYGKPGFAPPIQKAVVSFTDTSFSLLTFQGIGKMDDAPRRILANCTNDLHS